MLRTMRSESDCCCEDGILSCSAIATCLSGKRIIVTFALANDSAGIGDGFTRWSSVGGSWLIREKPCGYMQGSFGTTANSYCTLSEHSSEGCDPTGIAQWALGWRYPRVAPRMDGEPYDAVDEFTKTFFSVNVRLQCSVVDNVATLTFNLSLELGSLTGTIPPIYGSACLSLANSPGVAVPLPVTPADLLAALNAEGLLLAADNSSPVAIGELFSSASIEVLGVGCGPCATNPPTISFEMDNENVLGIDPCTGLEGEIDTGCTFTLSATTEEGDAPLRECFWEDGVVGCDRTTITLGSDCGEQEITLGVEALDDNGCVGEAEESFTCCRCCTPSGGYSITEADFDEFAIPGGTAPAGAGCSVTWGSVQCTDGGGVHTVAFAHQYCFYTITFEEGETTDCGDVPNPVRYKVEWDGLTDHDGNPLADGCYDAGDIVNFRHDPGGEGFPACLTITVLDSIGCAAEPSYEPFPYAFSVPPGTDPDTYEPECVRELLDEFYCGDWEG